MIVAVFAPWIAPYGFDTKVDGVKFPKLAPPSSDTGSAPPTSLRHLLRVIWGARTALEVIMLAVIFSLRVGVPLGLLSGYFGGWLDRILVS